MARRSLIVVLITHAIAGSAVAVDTEGLAAAMREALEVELRTAAGYGYRSFACDIDQDVALGNRFECSAVTESGEQIEYSIGTTEEGGATVVLTSQPASQLTAEDRAILEAPCRAFLEDYGRRAWDPMYASFHPALREVVSAEGARAMLEPVRSDLGSVRGAELVTHAIHESGRHELVYALDCEHGAGQARFGIMVEEEGTRLVAFVVTAAPGTPMQAAMLQEAAREMLGDLIGEPVVRVHAPLERLEKVGDAVEGSARLGDGRDVPIRAEQHGRKDDVQPIDCRFQVLDVPWLLRRMLAAQPAGVESVDCPQRVAVDGATMTCTATTGDGDRLALTIRRIGGDHRLVKSETLAGKGP
jgi:hypothetical protein